MEQEIYITTPFIKLGSLLKLADIGGSGGIGKMIIQDELVKLNGEMCSQRGKKVVANDVVEVNLDPNLYIIKVLQAQE
jgi:ribosome-associated protein